MWNKWVYLREGRRRPVLLGAYSLRGDIQGMLPRWWCSRCGGEVYEAGSRVCRRCIERKGAKDDENV